MIASLNKNIDKLQSQLDALAHRGDFHNQVNPLKAKVDNLTSKVLELEAQILSLKQKAASDLQEFLAKQQPVILPQPVLKPSGPKTE